jgi:hypothetical protein
MGVPTRGTTASCLRATQAHFRQGSGSKSVGIALDELVKLRNEADYQLNKRRFFADAKYALSAIHKAAAHIALLDQIEADPKRRAVAIASFGP